jgi:hypothetical protein
MECAAMGDNLHTALPDHCRLLLKKFRIFIRDNRATRRR